MSLHDPGAEQVLLPGAPEAPVIPPARVGHPAPDFEAAAYIDGGFRNVKLSDFRGRWTVLLFYPGDFTFVCPTELVTLVVRADELDALGLSLLAISTDSRYVHKAWVDSELSRFTSAVPTFPLLADPGGVIGRAYGVYEETTGAELRGRFLVDPEGLVRSIEMLPAEVARSVDELLRQVQAFQHHDATGELLPAEWAPGCGTIDPAPEMLGRLWEVWHPEE